MTIDDMILLHGDEQSWSQTIEVCRRLDKLIGLLNTSNCPDCDYKLHRTEDAGYCNRCGYKEFNGMRQKPRVKDAK